MGQHSEPCHSSLRQDGIVSNNLNIARFNFIKKEIENMKIGFVGLGIMGKPMAKNLIKAGYDLIVYDPNLQAVEEVAAAGIGYTAPYLAKELER